MNLFTEPKEIYDDMLIEIKKASKSIFIESYIFDDDSIGKQFGDLLLNKAREGIQVVILLDFWGSFNLPNNYFDEIIQFGGKFAYFRPKRFLIKLNKFKLYHRRNHRKLTVIDEKICYLGSMNITNDCLNWVESVLKFTGEECSKIVNLIMQDYKIKDKFLIKKRKGIFEFDFFKGKIVLDLPSFKRQIIRKKYIDMINNAKNSVFIETAYLIPDSKFKRALKKAVRRGVDVRIIISKHSDHPLIDIARQLSFGFYHRHRIKLFFHEPKMIHSKYMIVDGNEFILGSTNLDYRSFKHQFEIVYTGSDLTLNKAISTNFFKHLENCEGFNFKEWKNRPWYHKLIESIAYQFRFFL